MQLERYEGLLKDLAIPPRPDVLTVLFNMKVLAISHDSISFLSFLQSRGG